MNIYIEMNELKLPQVVFLYYFQETTSTTTFLSRDLDNCIVQKTKEGIFLWKSSVNLD